MISKLLEVRGKKPGKNVQLSEEDIKHLCTKSREIFISQPNLLELEAPIKICGKSFTTHLTVFFPEYQPTCQVNFIAFLSMLLLGMKRSLCLHVGMTRANL